MKLTKLEIKGFKSFADKTPIYFGEGITAIVGPNGCGKSNVIDAIRWVLGEQSTRVLRSEKMENIIFNGSKSRKTSNLAEVSLTFDNTKNILPTEYTQVNITRKLYRTGDSEYYLNDVLCRLKDISDLFLDTGVGTNTYSIIELKMIEEMLNNREGSRRFMFEEAAGISKYKVRKKQTFNKLKETQTDLDRIDDILFEVQQQLKVLESQAKKTERYYSLKDEYKELNIKLAALRMKDFKESAKTIDIQLDKLIDEDIALQTEGDKLGSSLEQQKLANLSIEKNLSVQQKATNEFVNGIRQYENDKKLKNEQLKFLKEKENRLELEISKDKLLHEELASSIIQLQQRFQEETLTLRKVKIDLETLHVQQEDERSKEEDKKREINILDQKRVRLQDEVYKIEKERDILRVQFQSLQQELNRNEKNTQDKESELRAFDNTLKRLKETLKDKEEHLQKTVKEEETIQQGITDTVGRMEAVKDRITTQTRTLDAKQNEYNLTKSLVDNLEGYPESIKFLRKNKTWSKKAPLLSDIFFCKEDYRVAMENYLEPYLNYYVVEQREEAFAAIQLLAEGARGRSHFFILNEIKHVEYHDAVVIENGIPAHTVIEVDEKYMNLCSFLLKDVFFIEQDEDRLMQEQNDSQTVLLAKSGRYAKAPCRISGGSIGIFEGKRIGRAKNLEFLQKDIDQLVSSIALLKKQTEAASQTLTQLKQSTKTGEINTLKQELNRLHNELTVLETRHEQHTQFINEASLRKEDIEQKGNNYEKRLSEVDPLLKAYLEEKETISEKLKILQNEHAYITETLLKYTSDYNQKNINFHRDQSQASVIQKDLEYKTTQEKDTLGRIHKNSLDLKEAKEKIKASHEQFDLGDHQLKSMYEQKTVMEEALQEIETEYYNKRHLINKLESSLNELRKRNEHVRLLLSEYKEKKTELSIKEHSLKERLSVEFNIESEELSDHHLPEESEEMLKQRSDKVKNSLDNFGAINPLALESFREMNERYLFILSQKKDLVEAKESLMQTISEIDDTAREKFMNAFNRVRDNFQTVFRSLFNEEDSCDLALSNVNDPLESDIEIIAQPKGKRPLSINQLSGGEKTLTAIAILFSLYLLKPAPFCIFDEVDAPLDDTNIDKFNQIIRRFSKDSQFILVSHNKRTIAQTDIMYGVTMVEEGISRVVPVDMQGVEATNV